jgi:hypothetical protein
MLQCKIPAVRSEEKNNGVMELKDEQTISTGYDHIQQSVPVYKHVPVNACNESHLHR